jgi:hypothetical protein
MEDDLTVQFKKVDITPEVPVRLAGYFNERLSSGVLDPIYLRLGALRKGENRHLYIQIDNCAVLDEDVREIKNEIAHQSSFQSHEIMVLASHTHTGPDVAGFFGLPRDFRYLENLKKKIIGEALSLNPSEKSVVHWARTAYQGLAFNRRWTMKNGRVMTNPPKLSPEMDRPEGAIDRDVSTIVFTDEAGAYQAFFVNISNHTDTIGGDHISADWPGFMERFIQQSLGTDVPVFPLIAPQGNVNHLEFHSSRSQTNYGEAARLGRAYADVVSRSLTTLRLARIEHIRSREIVIAIPSLDVSDSELEKAKEILAGTKGRPLLTKKDLTAEDLAKGDASIERLFAESLLRFAQSKPDFYRVPLQVFELGKIAFAAIPGEPFVEIGLALKTSKSYDLIVPVALANGYFGYIPLQECFDRGGYEVRAGAACCLAKDAAQRILSTFRELLNSPPPES